jgi:ribonuclease HI
MITLNFDGACGPYNPGGHMGCGVIIKDKDNKVLHTIQQQYSPEQFNNETSNNLAEYIALILGLQWCIDNNYTQVNVIGDSQLVINQMTNKFKIKSGVYVEKAYQAKEMITKFSNINFTHVKREFNTEADELSTIIVDGYNSQTDPIRFRKKEKKVTNNIQQPQKVRIKIQPLNHKDSLDPIKVAEWQEKYRKAMNDIKPVRKIK